MLSESPPREVNGAVVEARSRLQAIWRHQELTIPIGIALISRLVVLVVADLLMRFALVGHYFTLPYTGPIAVWQRKDAGWYLAIARQGYADTPLQPYLHLRANFFPLYPLLIHLVAQLFALFPLAHPYAIAGMLVSWVAFAFACVGLYRLTRGFFGSSVAVGATLLLAAFPFSLYDGAVYTEALYLALAVWAFVCIERRQWWAAGALAGLACAVRPPGLLVGACVALAYLLDWLRERRPLRFDILALALTPLGLLAYVAYCWARWGEPFAYLTASRLGWHGGHLQMGGLRAVATALSSFDASDGDHILTCLAILLSLGFLALIPIIWRRLGPVYALFTLASVMAPILDFPTLHSLGRYLSVAFPVFMALAFALRGRPRLLAALAAVSGILLMLCATYFIAGYGLS